METCRLIVDEPAPGAWNMAVDEALLDAAVEERVATLRLYRWSEPTLSLGYFQRYDDRRTHPASSACAVVRRQSGGGAILHDHELTYSLALPPRHPLTRDAASLYTAVHNAFLDLLAPRLVELKSTWRLALRKEMSHLAPRDEPFLCFERRACGDLLLVPTHDADEPSPASTAYKILGSAQRRHRGAILQHGGLLVERSPAALELPGWRELVGQTLPLERLTSGLVQQLSGLLPLEPEATELPVAIRDAARQIERTKYASRSWTTRR